MLEKNLQKKCLHFCKKLGILAVKVESSSTRGWPDLTVVLPTGQVIFVELKSETGRLSEMQKRTIQTLQEQNAKVYVCYTFDEFQAAIAEHFIG